MADFISAGSSFDHEKGGSRGFASKIHDRFRFILTRNPQLNYQILITVLTATPYSTNSAFQF